MNGSNEIDANQLQLVRVYAYQIILPTLLAVGITGNLLNLLTLRSASLSTVPFMYIRAVAVFDLIGLILVIPSLLRVSNFLPGWYWLVAYQSHIELPAINSLFCASLFTALSLTVERWRLVCHPHGHQTMGRLCHRIAPSTFASLLILMALCAAVILHIPMAFEHVPKWEPSIEGWTRINNPILFSNSTDPLNEYIRYFDAYKITRESTRILSVLALVIINITILHELQKTKRNRRRLTRRRRRPPPLTVVEEASDSEHLALNQSITSLRILKQKLSCLSFQNSFTERRITVVMTTITVLYVLGNIPAAILMIVNRDDRNKQLTFIIFKAFANLCETANHCANFYCFCMTSADYRATFARGTARFVPGMHSIRNPTPSNRISIEDASNISNTVDKTSFTPVYGRKVTVACSNPMVEFTGPTQTNNHLTVTINTPNLSQTPPRSRTRRTSRRSKRKLTL